MHWTRTPSSRFFTKHFTRSDGATAVEAIDDLEAIFNNLHQGLPTQNIAVFKKEFETQTRCLEISSAAIYIGPITLDLEVLEETQTSLKRVYVIYHPFDERTIR
jgi:hypothetical protein